MARRRKAARGQHRYLRLHDLSRLTACPDWKAHDGPVCVLGAGGAARAIVYGFLEAGVDEVRVFNRTRARAEAAAERVRAARQGVRLGQPQRRRRAKRCRAGQHHDRSASRAPARSTWISPASIADCVVSDIVYVPLETELLAQARGTRPAHRRWARHAAASGGAGLREVVRRASQVTDELRDILVADIEGRTC